ncbi:MAG: HNH endonuclease [Gammaproteobacteria bacterium]|nr:MAG: HNH endonuclease [Gammaproteobacteria bacterium]UCH39806.1 MAG: HNH endonuclease [Gammaproteobacteria bacterium]
MKEMQANSLVLALDRAGNPSAWLDNEMAVHLVATDRVLAPLGWHSRVIYGGTNAVSGLRSSIEICSILLTNARVQQRRWQRDYTAPLTNRALFARDGYLCLYCGQPFSARALTRDHILPVSRGGRNVWTNVASACRSCNQRKNNRTPAEWGVELIAVPYAPCYAEHLILNSKNILADQMEFLRARVRRR